MKAISLEVKNLIFKNKLESYATSCYLLGFLTGTFYLLILFISCVLKVIFDIVSSLLNIPNTSFTLFLAYAIIIFIMISILIYLMNSKFSNKITKLELETFKEIDPSAGLIIIFLVLTFILAICIYVPDIHVVTEMDDIYSNQSEQIPIDITVTGLQYNDITVNLSKVDIKDNLKLIDSIDMKVNSDHNKVVSSEYLIGNNLEFGKYKFYINCTNLSGGYYELSVTTHIVGSSKNKFGKTTNSFYLV